MLNKKWIFGAAVLYLGSTVAYAALPANKNHCILLGSTPSLIVKFNHAKSSKKAKLTHEFLQRFHIPEATFTHARPLAGDAYIVFFTPSKSLQAKQAFPGCYAPSAINRVIQHLKAKKNVTEASPNKLNLLQMNKYFKVPVVGPKQWNLKTFPGGIEAETAYNTTTGSANAVVAVLDTGIVTNISLTPNIRSGVSFTDNGTFHNGAAPSCGAECPGYDHGTHVAGTVAASGTLAYGEMIYGVAPTANVIPINVFTKITDFFCFLIYGTPSCLTAYDADLLNAVAWLDGTAFAGLPTAPYVTSANMSLGGSGTCDPSFQTYLNSLFAKDISFAVAAGNDNADAAFFSPANCTGVMTIAATGATGAGAFYSNYGAIVAFAAPGGDNSGAGGTADEIYSTVENGYAYFQGTSMASPHVAGLTALMYTVDPTLTTTLVTSLIASNTNPFVIGIHSNCTGLKPCGTGVANADATIQAVVAQAPTLTWAAPNLTATPTDTTVTLDWDAAAWSAPRTTGIIYTAYINGVAKAECTNVSATSCVITHLTRLTNYSAYVTATDARSIYAPPPQSNTAVFNTTGVITPMVVSIAERNPLLTSQAFVYYNSLGTAADSYSVDGIPGATVTINTDKRRFIVSNISNPRRIPNVSIVANIGIEAVASNPITIPNIL